MATSYGVYASDYRASIQSVLLAGQQLRNVLDEDRETREFAIERLEQATQQYETGGITYHKFMFSEVEMITKTEEVIQERLVEDILASMLIDLNMANVLIAAGQTLGELGKQVEPGYLDEALHHLEDAMQIIGPVRPVPLIRTAIPGRSGFTEEAVTRPIPDAGQTGEVLEIPSASPQNLDPTSVGPDIIRSADLLSAIETFRYRSEEILTILVAEAKQTATSIVTELLQKYDQIKIFELLSKLGEQAEELPKIGRLFNLGLEKLTRIRANLIRFFSSEKLAQLSPQLEEFWQSVTGGKYIDQALAWSFGVEAVRTDIVKILSLEGLKRETLDEASNDLIRLQLRLRIGWSVSGVSQQP